MILFQNILLLKEFLVCNGCFVLSIKIIKRPGTCFCCTFLAWFFYKNVLYLILHLWAKFQCHTFLTSQDIKQCFIEFLFRQFMTSWTLKFIFDHRLKQWPTGRKRGKDSNTKMWISQERKKLFRWNQKHFSKISKGYHLVKGLSFSEKIKNWWK